MRPFYSIRIYGGVRHEKQKNNLPKTDIVSIAECCQNRLTDHQWCVAYNIKPGTFYNWVKKLRQKDCVDLPASTGRSYSAPESQEVVRVDLHDTDNFPMNSNYIGFRHLRKEITFPWQSQ